MKQERTVKNLLSRKHSLSERFLTILLLVLSVVLCLWAATLMTTSVWAAENEEITNNNEYSWYDDRIEVLYRLELSKPDELYDSKVEEFYMKNDSLYVTPNKVVISGAGNDGGYSFLWWSKNKLESDNITMMAWHENTIKVKNDSSSVLWWFGNSVKWNSDWAPAVLAWWKWNVIDGNNGDVILWGSGNVIQNLSNSVIILWWEGNEIKNWNNVIVWWRKVKVNNVSNIFAFSNGNSDFKPEDSNAFYLNLTNWVWINTGSEKTWMAIWGAVWFWSVDWKICDANNIWVEWILTLGGYGCLVWCTKESVGKWELLDRWSLCEKKCTDNSEKCIKWTDLTLEEGQNYTAFCSSEIPEGAVQCITWEWESYQNVVFQTIRVYNLEDCASIGDNKCAYYCEDGENCEEDNGSQDEPTSCDGWYHLENGKCEPNTKLVDCNEGRKPDYSKYIVKQVLITWLSNSNGWSTPENCGWECDEGYTKGWNACILNKCVWNEPEHAYFLTWSDEWLTVDIQKQVIKYSQKDDDIRCAYLCESGYVAVLGDIGWGNVGYMCDQCESWTYDANNPDVCVRIKDCPEGYVRDSSLGSGCYLKWVCRYSNGLEYTWKSLWSIVWSYWDMEPISTQDFNFKCRDNDKYKWVVEPHTCTYACKTWYYCNGYTCSKPQCKSNKDFGAGSDGKYYYYSTWKAGHYDFHWWYTMIFVTGSNITTSWQFYEEYHNKSGCYYWCPPENRYYVANSVFLWRCGSLDTVAANQYKCGNLYLYWYGVSTGHAEVDKQRWVYTGDYNAVLNRKWSCIWSCEPGSQVMHGVRMTQKWEEEKYGYPSRLFLTWSSGKICYKNCLKDWKYMWNDGKCYSCQQWFKLDEEKLWVTILSGKEYKEYRGCVPDCPSWSVWRYIDGSYVCMLRKVWGSCPEGYVSDASSDWLCYMCLSSLETYVPWSWCVRNASSN